MIEDRNDVGAPASGPTRRPELEALVTLLTDALTALP
jgi:hypothetical protein